MTEEEKLPEKSVKKKEKSDLPFAAVIAEFLFVLLPLVVILIVRLSQSQVEKILTGPEFSFAAAVLFGQSIVKIVSGSAASNQSLHWQNIGLVVSAFIVLGLAPSLTVLVLIMLTTTPSTTLGIIQLVFLALASVCFFTFGTAGQIMLTDSVQRP